MKLFFSFFLIPIKQATILANITTKSDKDHTNKTYLAVT